MTVKQVEPLKFKGNKTWYLHKLSEKGADAIKCDFPNGDDTFTETTLQAAIEELAENGGGGSSSPSAQPDRVIIIDSSLTTSADDVPGKAYGTFARAKTYMDANSSLKFQVELPAGTFAEAVTIGTNYVIHGNNTTLTSPLGSTVMLDPQNIGLSMSAYGIKDCTIAGGLSTTEPSGDAYQLFVMQNCSLTDAGCTYLAMVVCQECVVNTTAPCNAMFNVLGGMVLNLTCMRVDLHSSFVIMGTISCPSWETARGQVRAFQSMLEQVSFVGGSNQFLNNCRVNQLNMDNPVNIYNSEGGIRITAQPHGTVLLSLSRIDLEAGASADSFPIYVHAEESQLNLATGFNNTQQDTIIYGTGSLILMNGTAVTAIQADARSEVNISTGTVTTLTAACDTVYTKNPDATVTNNHRPNRYMYSTDGGTTMSDDPTSATYVGVLIDPTVVCASAPVPGQYVWIPLS